MRVEEYMTSPVVVVRPGDTLAHARRLMLRYEVGRLPVIDEAGRVVGIITLYDVARAMRSAGDRSLDSIRVLEYMTRDPVTVKPSDSLKTAARLMVEKGVGGLPVVDEDGKLIGIISKTDLVHAFMEKCRGKCRVEEYMYREVARASPLHSIAYVARLMESTPSKRVLVFDGERLVGIIAPSDIAFLARPAPQKRSKKTQRVPGVKAFPAKIPAPDILVAADVMTPDPITIAPDADLADAARLMVRHGFSSLPVVDSEGVVRGIVTKHNILEALTRL
ncbi:MAG: CBS domain-containing protein [Crenarchaeota archaeon]|nr:CBS domain-containing protein [Thermoproteota archaeon]